MTATEKRKKHIRERVQAALKRLHDKDGISYEEIAAKLELSFNTIYTWRSGRRTPKLPVIRLLESLYEIEIL